jgi:hypothetical protein
VLSSGSTTTNTYNYLGSSNLLTNITQSATTVRSLTTRLTTFQLKGTYQA